MTHFFLKMTTAVILLPIIQSQNVPPGDADECVTCVLCSPCLIIAAPFLLIKKIWDCAKRPKPPKVVNDFPKPEPKVVNDFPKPEPKEVDDSLKQEHILYARKNAEIAVKCKEVIGSNIFDLITRGSHNQAVVSCLRNQPQWVLRHIFEDLEWTCGKERMNFLKKQVDYTPATQIIS